MKKFLVRYYNNNDWYSTYIYADDFKNAEQVCKRYGLQLDGEHKFTLCWPLGLLAQLIMR